MKIQLSSRARLGLAAAAIALAGVGIGYGIAQFGRVGVAPQAAEQGGRKVLYWYDPMVPSQHFDKPGKSPFMDMQLVPKFADEAKGEAGIAIEPTRTHSQIGRESGRERGGQTG